MSTDSTGWPLFEERRRGTPPPRGLARRTRNRPAWLLAVLAFVCGCLVSAAGFAIGWRHLAQSGTVAQSRLAAATARAQRLDASLAQARLADARTRQRLAAAEKSARTLSRAAAALAARASASEHAAGPVSEDAGAITATTTRLASELKTLSDYLTSTPAGQIDGGYVSTQIAYVTHQLAALQASGDDLGSAAATFRSDVHSLAADAAALSK